MRVMHTVNLFDPTLGYTEFYLAKEQIKRGYEVLVVTFNRSAFKNKGQDLGFQTVEGINVYYLKSLFGFRDFIWPLKPKELEILVKNFNPDIVHCHGLLSPLAQKILLLKTLGKYKVVGDIITGISPLTFIFLPKFESLFKFSFVKRVDAFFACTHAVENFLKEKLGFPPTKIHFLPLAADAELFRPDKTKREEIRSQLGLDLDDITVIYTGKFLPYKRVHDLLIASARVIKNGQEKLKVILIGDGPKAYKKRLEELINKLKIGKNVYIIKTVHRTELPNFYNAADIAVWPGAFSISIIEAMACGLPIVIAKSDWTSHYLEYGNGYCFKAGDINNLSSLLLTLVNDDKTRKLMGIRSRKLVEDKLNWSTVAKKYDEVYKSVLSI